VCEALMPVWIISPALTLAWLAFCFVLVARMPIPEAWLR
jgi:hypothetical protein